MFDAGFNVLDPVNSRISGGGSPRGSSSLRAIGACEALWHLSRQARKLEEEGEVPPEHLHLGSLVHGYLAYWRANEMPAGSRPAWFEEKSLAEWLAEASMGEYDRYARSCEIGGDFLERHGDRTTRETTLAVEQLVQVPLHVFDPYGALDRPGGMSASDYERENESLITGIMDHVYVDDERPEDVVIEDYKTQGGAYGAQHRLADWGPEHYAKFSFQAMQYLHLCRKAGLRVRGFQVTRIKRFPPFDTDTRIMSISPRAYAKFPAQVRLLVRKEWALRDRIEAGGEPEENYGACHGPYGPCDFIGLCHASDPDVAAPTLLGATPAPSTLPVTGGYV